MGIIGFILFILVIGEYQTSLKFYDLNLSSVYQVIANDHDDVRVMDLPFRQKTGRSWEMGKGFSKQQYAQTLHQKKLLSGYISYTDESVKAPVLSTPGVHYLATNFDDESESDKDPQLAKEGFAKYQVRYIVLSKKDGSAGEWYQMSQDKIDLADQYIKETLKGKIISQDENTILYRLDGI